MLRLVHPRKEGQEKVARRRHDRTNHNPTPEEQKRIHAAIKNVARAYGGRDVLAAVMGFAKGTLYSRETRSYGFAYLLARAAGITIEQLLSGQPHAVGSCPLCGRKGAR
ncbi:MAG: transcriptional regulator [Polyangiaceae bacterium]|nr:transcriptional regulator [Polyangiaceae bacterium]